MLTGLALHQLLRAPVITSEQEWLRLVIGLASECPSSPLLAREEPGVRLASHHRLSGVVAMPRSRNASLLGVLPLLPLLANLPAGLLAVDPAAADTIAAEQRDQRLRFIGVWSFVDNDNNLFNVRLSADGTAVSTSGVDGVPPGGSLKLRSSQLYELGRWQPWGNGIRIDYSDGWSDAIVVGPSGVQQWSWGPGASRSEPPTNYGKAVQVKGVLADAVGVYRFQTAEENLPPTTVSLMSNGVAFNSIDQLAGGVWSLKAGTVRIKWLSGWVTQFQPQPQGLFQVKIWQPDHAESLPPSAIRHGQRVVTAASDSPVDSLQLR